MRAVRNELLSEGQDVPLTKICACLGVARSTAYYEARERVARPLNRGLEFLIYEVIQECPAFGIRKVWAVLNFQLQYRVNRKAVARVMRRRGWTLKQRRVGSRPRVKHWKSIAERPDERWATDIALIFCGAQDGWCSLVPVVDCCTRQVLGWELARTARAKTAERALEAALLNRFGTTRGAPAGLTVRHDNGLVFGSELFRGVARDYGLRQEFITPYTPEQNGLAERFIRSLKEECAWLQNFESLEQARTVIAAWIAWYNGKRPHQALKYRTPDQAEKSFRAANVVAA